MQTFTVIGQILMGDSISTKLGIHKVLSRMQFGCLSSDWHFVCVPSDALPLCIIIKQSGNWLCRYCI